MAPAIGRHHAEWLSLVETSGPFLSVPVLSKALPQGLDAPDRDITARLRSAREQLDDDPTLHRSWCDFVLREVLDLDETLAFGAQIPTGQEHRLAEQGDTVRPDLVVIDHTGGAPKPAMHITIHPPGQRLDRRVADAAWSASPIDRVAALCRATHVSLGLATNGQSWTLVSARPGETTGACTWDADLWLEEPITLRAFRTLLGAHRFFSVADEDTLPALLAQSAKNQQEVTDRLGAQVRQAVELLIDALDRADHDRKGELLGQIPNEELYRAAVTMMMRLVFLFVAEERRLLPLNDHLYAESYAASTLREQLEERATKFGEDPLERSSAAWYRLLALSRAVQGGIDHEALRLPAYGGGLFDPDRYPFLEGRSQGSDWQDDDAAPLPVDDRTVLHMLAALQVLTEPGRAGQPPTSVRLSFRALDVEQIGHVYEGLLDHTAVRTFDAALGLVGPSEEEIALGELEALREQGPDVLVRHLVDLKVKSSQPALANALRAQPDPNRVARLLVACDNDAQLRDRVLPFVNVVRNDLRGYPRVFLPGSLYVTKTLERRSSGTYYTPRSLAEEIVQHALDAVAYSPGPAQKADPAEWQVKSSDTLLNLKIADIAMGSGAFLVAACRYLAARLQEAWEIERVPNGVETGDDSLEKRDPLPADPLEREVLAHRLVAERCLYGVDKNPMAVEMAKLSLWLVTLAKDRPFSFVDHTLREGDSLLGVVSLDQVRALHIEPARGRALHENLLGYTRAVVPAVDRALALRGEIESFVVRDLRDAQRKAELHQSASAALDDVRLLGDVVVGAALANRSEEELDAALASIEEHVPALLNQNITSGTWTTARQALSDASQRWLQTGRPDVSFDRRCFHWALEFPEVMERGGFDCIVGNPPFRGGVDLARTLGVPFERYLRLRVPESQGFVDLSVYFHRRCSELTRPDGFFGLLGPQSLTAQVNRRPGTEAIIAQGKRLVWARSRIPWPGRSAAIEVCTIVYGPTTWSTPPRLNGQPASSISPSLELGADLSSTARLKPWLRYSEGTKLYGASFVKTAEEWRTIAGPDSSVDSYLRLYVNAEILCDYADQQNGLCVPDFESRGREELSREGAVVDYLEVHVAAERADQTRQIHEHRPWLFWDKREKAYNAARALTQVIACPNLSKFLPMAFVPSERLFSHGVKFLVSDDPAIYGLLQSSPFLAWAVATSPRRGTSVAFSTRASLDTWVPPSSLAELRHVGSNLWAERKRQMDLGDIGLTHVLNRLHDPENASADARRLRQQQQRVDEAVALAYEWDDLTLGHDFRNTSQGVRFTVSATAKQEMFTRLLELNRKRAEAELGAGRKRPVRSSAKQMTIPQ